MAAPPVRFCGRTLYAGAMGLLVYRPPLARGSQVQAIVLGSSAQFLLVHVAEGCSQGAQVQIAPPGLVSVVNEIKARDGLPVAVELTGRHPGTGTLGVRGPGGIDSAVPLLVIDPGTCSGAGSRCPSGATVP
jgi:hypothetical protein